MYDVKLYYIVAYSHGNYVSIVCLIPQKFSSLMTQIYEGFFCLKLAGAASA